MFKLLTKFSPATIAILVICAALLARFVICADGACAELGKDFGRALLNF
jgi:hypothetical protein